MLGNYKILGVIFNNLGNIYANQGDYENAILNYEKALENARDLFEEKFESQKFTSEEYMERRGLRLMNLVLAYKSRVKTSKDSKTDVEVIKMLCNKVLNVDREKDAHHGR